MLGRQRPQRILMISGCSTPQEKNRHRYCPFSLMQYAGMKTFGLAANCDVKEWHVRRYACRPITLAVGTVGRTSCNRGPETEWIGNGSEFGLDKPKSR